MLVKIVTNPQIVVDENNHPYLSVNALIAVDSMDLSVSKAKKERALGEAIFNAIKLKLDQGEHKESIPTQSIDTFA